MGKRKERDAVVFLGDQIKLAGEVLSESECGRLFISLRDYALEGKEADLLAESRLYRSIYNMMRSAQDKAIEKYQEVCERNRTNIYKRWRDNDIRPNTTVYDANFRNTADTNIIEKNKKEYTYVDDPLDREGTGVPGIGWLE